MDIRERKWKLMQRDPLCIEFDKVLCASLNDSENQKLQDQRDEFARKIKEKWNVGIYTPEVQIKIGQMFERDPENPLLKNLNKEYFLGPFKWWTITGNPYAAVTDARQHTTMIFEDEKMKWYSFIDNGLVHCKPHEIPIIIDPTVINMNDAPKVKNEVWKIVKENLKSKKQTHKAKKGSHWNPTHPPSEPPELARIFRMQSKSFEKYLEWYDLIERGLSFRTVAAVECWNSTRERKQEIFENLLTDDSKPKIRKKIMGKSNGTGESNVRYGYNMIRLAIRKEHHSKHAIERYNCPKHGNQCSANCSYSRKWYGNFNRTQRDIPLNESLTADVNIKPLLHTSRKLPKKAEY